MKDREYAASPEGLERSSASVGPPSGRLISAFEGGLRFTLRSLDDILEKEWQSTVVTLAKQLGWLTYHTHDSRRSAHGFPDLVLVRDRVVYLELKRENRKTSKLTSDQQVWLRWLVTAGAEVYVVRPSRLQAVADMLSSRQQFPSPLLDEDLDDELGEAA